MPYDKKLHFGAGFVIALAGSFYDGPAFGFCCAVIAGLWKEVYDEYSYRGFDGRDLAYTCAGGLFGALAMGVIK